jgi:hypothetical protein
LKSIAVFCSVVEASGDAQIIRGLLNQLCTASPPTEELVALLPNFGQQVEQTANFCNLDPATDPGQLLSNVRSKCTTWRGLLGTICSGQRELCIAIFGGVP